MDLVQGLELHVEPGPMGERLLVVDGTGGAALPEPDWPQVAAGEQTLAAPGVLPISPGWQLLAEVLDLPEGRGFEPSAWEAWLDADAAGPALTVQRAGAGERFQPLGMETGSVKLSDFWINSKLPQRAHGPGAGVGTACGTWSDGRAPAGGGWDGRGRPARA